MRDIIIFIVFAVIEILTVYCFVDTLRVVLMHREGRGVRGIGRILKLRRVMRRSGRPHSIPLPHGKTDRLTRSREVKCDYMVDLEYTREDGERVVLRDFVIPSKLKEIAGGTELMYCEGDDIPIKYSPKYRKLVVVDAPDVRGREGGTFMLYIWGLAVIFIAVFIMTLIASL